MSQNRKNVDVLAAELVEKETRIAFLMSQLAEKEKIIASLSYNLADEQRKLESQSDLKSAEEHSPSTRLAGQTALIENLSRQIAEKQHAVEALRSRLERQEKNVRSLSQAIAEKETEVERIKATPAWKLLSLYGRFKYRYLLPIYKALGLPPYEKKKRDSAAGDSMQADPLPSRTTSQSRTPEGERQKAPDGQQRRRPAMRCVSNQFNAYDIVCFPVIDWDFRFQRPQQLMSRFAEAGHRVFYIAQTFDSGDSPYTIREKSKNVWEVRLRGLVRNVYTDTLDDRACDALLASLDALRRDQLLGATISFAQLPFWWPLVRQARSKFGWPVAYDCMDHHAGFSTNRRQMLDQESNLLSSADVVAVSSKPLEEKARQYNPNVLLVCNACDYEHFANTGRIQNPRPVIGYYGAIAEWFDSDLISELAQKRPDWDFVLVGSTFTADCSRLSTLPNVSLPGEKPYSEIPEWLGKFDVTIIPFKRNALTEATNPVKAYEILASGKPIVSVPIPEMVSLAPLVRLASSIDEFEREITNSLCEDEELTGKRRAFAKEQTWVNRYDLLTPNIRNLFHKASIIIVTFNNLALNRLCLESLYARTEWPSFEVIVVDNGSTDGTPEFLKEAEKTYPNLRVILNQSNLGFAAANNIGLRHATGRYLVLLNNDTVVTRGWLSALIRHLHVNPDMGLIGPVTNAVGNEAKVEVGYVDLHEMTAWAADYVWEHDGESVSIPMLAMFCVLMTREVFESVGFLDERFEVGMFEDDDYCRRVRERGYQLCFARDSFVHHWQKASFRLLGEEEYLRIYGENERRYKQKWPEDESVDQTLRNRKAVGSARARKQLNHIIERAKASKGTVVLLPSVGWGIHLFQRPHHLAREFARRGYLCIFDSSNAHDDVDGFREIESNLFLFRGNEEILGQIPELILWTFPYNFNQTHSYPVSAVSIYDWIDDLEVFPYDRGLLESNHSRALREASIVACVARRLHDRAREVRSDSIYLPNAVEYDHFAGDAAPALNDPDLRTFLQNGNPIAGYYGALAEWFDYDLLASVASLRPDWNFLLIGPQYDKSLSGRTVLTRPNVRWIGPRKYESLPAYLQLFDVATIPFAINDITLATSPLKLYEYFAGGKPVIATPMPECTSIDEVQIARTAVEFAEMLDGARERGQDQEFQKRLRALAKDNSWTTRVETVERALEAKIGAKDPGHPQADVSKPAPIALRDPALRSRPGLDPEAARLAERFKRFRTANNERFFDALCAHLASIWSDPCLPRYFEFAITCNERGRQAADLLINHTSLAGKSYLDVGCAYGGFLVAFAERNAEATGIDIDESLLRLAEHNLADNGLHLPLFTRDATRAADLQTFDNKFDLITCNDVIEHVEDPQALLNNLSSMSTREGIVYLEIPNRYHPRFVLEDGHYQLFGITLLEYPEAEQYYSLHAPGIPYTVRHYLDLDEYARMFARAGLQLTVLPETLDGIRMDSIIGDVTELRKNAANRSSQVPSVLRERVNNLVTGYLQSLESASRSTASQQRDFKLRYGASFWRVLGRKVGEGRDRDWSCY